MSDQREIENVLANHEAEKKKKKKVNSGDKGDRTERALCKLLSERFGADFERSVGSGNRWKQVKSLSESSKNVLVGDIVCPDGFAWVLESKGGYEGKVDFHSLFLKGNATIDSFIEQVMADVERCKKQPMILYKRNLRQWIAFVPTALLPTGIEFDYSLNYRDWTAVALEKLLEAPDEYFLWREIEFLKPLLVGKHIYAKGERGVDIHPSKMNQLVTEGFAKWVEKTI
jgi:hypothetical protein